MTRLFVDQREINPVPGNLLSLDEILKHVEDSHLDPDTVICQVQVDGKPLIFGEIDRDAAAMASLGIAAATVEIFTGKLSAIALDSVKEAAIYITRIEAVIPSLAMGLRSNPSPQHFEALKQFCDGFLWLNLLLAKVGAGADHRVGRDTVDAEARQRLVAILNELVQAQERRDFVLVADILEHEILALLPEYRQQFLDIRENLEIG